MKKLIKEIKRKKNFFEFSSMLIKFIIFILVKKHINWLQKKQLPIIFQLTSRSILICMDNPKIDSFIIFLLYLGSRKINNIDLWFISHSFLISNL